MVAWAGSDLSACVRLPNVVGVVQVVPWASGLLACARVANSSLVVSVRVHIVLRGHGHCAWLALAMVVAVTMAEWRWCWRWCWRGVRVGVGGRVGGVGRDDGIGDDDGGGCGGSAACAACAAVAKYFTEGRADAPAAAAVACAAGVVDPPVVTEGGWWYRPTTRGDGSGRWWRSVRGERGWRRRRATREHASRTTHACGDVGGPCTARTRRASAVRHRRKGCHGGHRV